jgi:hypothetical protein
MSRLLQNWFLALLTLALPGGAMAQTQAAPAPPGQAAASATPQRICDQPVPPPASLPPDNSGPVIYQFALCFLKQGNVSAVEPQTYLYYTQLRPSLPSLGMWVPYT